MSGRHTSTGWPRSSPPNPSARTPTIVNVCPLAVSGVPTIDGLAARLRLQKPWPMTTTGGAEAAVSAGVSKRPSAGPTPSSAKYSPVTDATGTRATVLSTCHDAGVVELRSDLGEGRHVRLERQIVRVRRGAVRAAAVVAGVNGDERSGIGHARRRSEEQRAHEPEHGRVGAGRDADGQEGNRRGPRRLDDHPQRVPHILNEAVHGSRSSETRATNGSESPRFQQIARLQDERPSQFRHRASVAAQSGGLWRDYPCYSGHFRGSLWRHDTRSQPFSRQISHPHSPTRARFTSRPAICACRCGRLRLAAASLRFASTTRADRKATTSATGSRGSGSRGSTSRRRRRSRRPVADDRARSHASDVGGACRSHRFGAAGNRAGDSAALRAARHHHAGDGVHRDPRGLRCRVRPVRGGARARHHSRQRQSSRARADDHRPAFRGEDQREHRQFRRQLVDRRGGRQAAVGDAVGRGYGHGPLDRQGHPRDARVDSPQRRGSDRHRPHLPGAREGRRPS